MDTYLYIQLRDSFIQEKGRKTYLKDIADLSGPEDLKEKAKGIMVLGDRKNHGEEKVYKENNFIGRNPAKEIYSGGVVTLTLVEIIEIIKKDMEGIQIFPIGRTFTTIQYKDRREKGVGGLLVVIKGVLTSFLLFIGSGLAIMYFHEDVNMHKVHDTILRTVSGPRTINPFWLSIPYSLGIGLGIAFFFDIFSGKRSLSPPNPLEIGLHKYKNDIYSVLASRGQGEKYKKR